MPTAMLLASIYKSIITQYSTAMLSTSNNNIMISLLPLPCCLLYILSIQGQHFQQTIYNAYQAVLISSRSAYYVCVATIYDTLYLLDITSISEYVNLFWIMNYPLLSFLHLIFQPYPPFCHKTYLFIKIISKTSL